MKKNLLLPVMMLILLIPVMNLTSCGGAGQDGSVVDMILNHECNPPVLKEIEVPAPDSVGIIFDEWIRPLEDTFGKCTVSSSGNYLHIGLYSQLIPGQSTEISGTVVDRYGNTNTFNVTVWGLNTDPAVLRINEFTTKGTKTQPDRTELKVIHGGSIAGMVLYDGVPDSMRNMVVLPNLEVQPGTFITVWWNDTLPQNIPETETANINVLAGGGLSENNGIMCLCMSPMQGAQVLDCVVWSAMASAQYDGYGTKEVWQRVSQAIDNGWWTGDPVYSGWSTSTRAMALGRDGEWYTTVQGGITFGSENISDAYKPD